MEYRKWFGFVVYEVLIPLPLSSSLVYTPMKTVSAKETHEVKFQYIMVTVSFSVIY